MIILPCNSYFVRKSRSCYLLAKSCLHLNSTIPNSSPSSSFSNVKTADKTFPLVPSIPLELCRSGLMGGGTPKLLRVPPITLRLRFSRPLGESDWWKACRGAVAGLLGEESARNS
mmetsp:Transcript_32557/g.42881  ORF Transcript_32557/g.42881 Transcript_32557/m.42881 type:complete len:115 (+) Transcript_32557:280-624(+)